MVSVGIWVQSQRDLKMPLSKPNTSEHISNPPKWPLCSYFWGHHTHFCGTLGRFLCFWWRLNFSFTFGWLTPPQQIVCLWAELKLGKRPPAGRCCLWFKPGHNWQICRGTSRPSQRGCLHLPRRKRASGQSWKQFGTAELQRNDTVEENKAEIK